ENIISANMLSRENKSTKSGTVNVFTICSDSVICYISSGVSKGISAPVPGGKMTVATNIKTEAIIPVITKMVIIDPMILPSLVILFIFAIAEEIVKKTSGITTINNKLIKMSPKGLM